MGCDETTAEMKGHTTERTDQAIHVPTRGGSTSSNPLYRILVPKKMHLGMD